MTTTSYGVMTLFRSDIPGLTAVSNTDSEFDTIKLWLDGAASLGSQVIRLPVGWSVMQPTSADEYDMGYINLIAKIVEYAKSLKIDVILEVGESPEWARIPEAVNEVTAPPKDPNDYAKAVIYLNKIMDERGLDDAVSAYEVWNEPNIQDYWAGGKLRNDLSNTGIDQDTDQSVDEAAALAYVRLLNATYVGLKNADPDAVVLGGALAGTDIQYVEWMLEAGAKMDGLSVHPYIRNFDGLSSKPAWPDQDPRDFDYTLEGSELAADINERFSFKYGLTELIKLLDADGRADTNLWLTEMGFRIADLNDNDTSDDHLVLDSAEEQGQYMSAALDVVESLGRVEAVTVFQLFDAVDGDFGILNADGTPRPAGIALQNKIAEQTGQAPDPNTQDPDPNLPDPDATGQEVVYDRKNLPDFDAKQNGSSLDNTLLGTQGNDNMVGYKGDDTFYESLGDDFLKGGNGEDAARYFKASTNYQVTANADGTFLVLDKTTRDVDLLSSIEKIQFSDTGLLDTAAIADAPIAVTPGGNPITGTNLDDFLIGTAGNDVLNGLNGSDLFAGSAGNDTIIGGGTAYNQIDYPGAASQYAFSANADGTVTAVKPNGGTDILSGIGGIWFADEDVWYPMDDLVSSGSTVGAGQSKVINGTNGDDYLIGTDANDVITGFDGVNVFEASNGNDTIKGGQDYDQVNFEGSSSDYVFDLGSDGALSVTAWDGDIDLLINIDGLYFEDSDEWLAADSF